MPRSPTRRRSSTSNAVAANKYPAILKTNGAEKTLRDVLFSSQKVSAGDDADFHRLHVHALFLQPLDGGLHFIARAVQFQADDADLVSDASLADVRHDPELLPDLIDERLLDELGRIHQP